MPDTDITDLIAEIVAWYAVGHVGGDFEPNPAWLVSDKYKEARNALLIIGLGAIEKSNKSA